MNENEEKQLIELLTIYNDFLNFEYAQFGLDKQDVEQFIKYYKENYLK